MVLHLFSQQRLPSARVWGHRHLHPCLHSTEMPSTFQPCQPGSRAQWSCCLEGTRVLPPGIVPSPPPVEQRSRLTPHRGWPASAWPASNVHIPDLSGEGLELKVTCGAECQGCPENMGNVCLAPCDVEEAVSPGAAGSRRGTSGGRSRWPETRSSRKKPARTLHGEKARSLRPSHPGAVAFCQLPFCHLRLKNPN